jgi:hypothetical protein
MRVSREFGRPSLRADMLQTFVRTAGAVALATILLAGSPARAGDVRIVVRVYDMATANAAGRAGALHEAAQALASAGISVDWRDCSRGGASHPCRTVRDAGDLVVRIMRTRAPGTAELGFAAVDPSGRATVIATVYSDVVREVASRTGLDEHVLLGRAIAHEIGHLLLRAPGHGGSGLMRPLWTDAELAANRPADWAFTDEESRRLQATTREPETSPGDAAGIIEAGR